MGQRKDCSAKGSAWSKISAEDNGDYILGSGGHYLHALLPCGLNYEYGLLQESDHAINLCPRSKKTSEYQGRKWNLHQDNARPHVSMTMLTCFAQKKTELRPHPTYSLDLAQNHFFLFPNLKKELKGRCFSSREEIVGIVQAILKILSKNRFEIMLEKWVRHWEKLRPRNPVLSKLIRNRK